MKPVGKPQSKAVSASKTNQIAVPKPPGKPPAAARFPRDEMSTGIGSAKRRASSRVIGGAHLQELEQAAAKRKTAIPAGRDFQGAFDRRQVQLGKLPKDPAVLAQLARSRKDESAIKAAVAAVDAKIAKNEDPKTWAGVPKNVARAEQAEMRAQLQQEKANLEKFGVAVATMTPAQLDDLDRFFKMAKEDPEGLKRFMAAHQDTPAATATPSASEVNTSPTSAPENIQAAIDFGMTQLGAPYVGGASPFRFGTPGNGQTYEMNGQSAYVSRKGVIGYDCSGLMVTMLKKAGIDISRFGSSSSMKANLPKVSKDQIQPGDLIVKNGHVSMYIGNGQMIESCPTGVKVSDASRFLSKSEYTVHRPG